MQQACFSIQQQFVGLLVIMTMAFPMGTACNMDAFVCQQSHICGAGLPWSTLRRSHLLAYLMLTHQEQVIYHYLISASRKFLQ